MTDDAWAWELRLFCSADIVGSTAFKAKTSSDSKYHWAATFSEFFQSFPQELESSYEKLPEGFDDCKDKLTPWKFSGDEILFSTAVTNHKQGVSHIWAFKNAVQRFPKENWIEKKLPLDLKATGWIAGFPVMNRRVHVPGSSAVDFLGPGIDLGFRISKFSTPKKFILSADLALLVMDGADTCQSRKEDSPILILDNKQVLKGVINNSPYPIVYCDMLDGNLSDEEKLLGHAPVDNPKLLQQYLRDFIDSTPNLIRPFINGDASPNYNTVPSEIKDLREDMKAEETGRHYLSQETEPAVDGDSKEPTKPSVDPPSAKGE